MPQMTHSKPIRKEPKLTQAWLEGFEKYREQTALFPHPENAKTVKKEPSQSLTLPGFESKAKEPLTHKADIRATFPMLCHQQRIR